VRDTAVIAKTGPRNVRVGGKSLSEYYWSELSRELIIAENELKEKIKRILEDSWLQ
jgi:hypothetical protein